MKKEEENKDKERQTAYLSARQVANEWGITKRWVQMLCKSGRIAGAKKNGISWMIPTTVQKPADRRITDGHYVKGTLIACNIQWDVDEPEDLEFLPETLVIPEELKGNDEAISDYISTETGFCHYGFLLTQKAQEKKRKEEILS